MNSVIGNFIMGLFCSEAANIKANLELQDLPELKLNELPALTVDYNSRFDLEDLQFIRSLSLPNVSDSAIDTLTLAFRSCVTLTVKKCLYPMKRLHGFSSGKALMASNPLRRNQPDMVSFGRLVDDLTDLKGLTGGEIINACLNWECCRFNEVITIVNDSWHNRYYWLNGGGSHHMGVLCKELFDQGKNWTPEVELRRYEFDFKPLEQLRGKVALYVTKSLPDAVYSPFKKLPSIVRKLDTDEKLGFGVIQWPTTSVMRDFYIVAVDLNAPLSAISVSCLEKGILEDKVITFENFVKNIFDHSNNSIPPSKAPTDKVYK